MNGRVLTEIAVGTVVIGGLVSATISELQVNGRTDYTHFYKSTSFWMLIVVFVIMYIYINAKDYISKKVEVIIDGKMSGIENSVITKIKADLKSELKNDITSASKKHSQSTKNELRQSLDARIQNYYKTTCTPETEVMIVKAIDKFIEAELSKCIENKVMPVVHAYVKNEIEKIGIEEKIELHLYRNSRESQVPNEVQIDIDKLASRLGQVLKDTVNA
ncbi:TPA: hypothetical protein ROY21_005131 [Bacillus cereus]|nr:hypothetical protein [Bacillus cereus]